MTSEIRVNKINNRAGLGTITIADTGVIVNGIVTCTEISGLNALNIAGVSTFASPLDINGDIDVDGHTNLDNLSVAGVATFSSVVNATSFAGNISGTTAVFDDFLNVGSNIKLGNAGVITATSFSGDGSSLTGIAATTNVRTNSLEVSGVSTFSGNANFTNPVSFGGDSLADVEFKNGNNTRVRFDVTENGLVFLSNSYLFFDQNGTVIYRTGQDTRMWTQDTSKNLSFGTNTEKLEVNNAGVNVAGIVTATSFSGDGSSLSNLPAGAPVGGASTNTVFFENDKAVAVNYQITSTKNAMSAGPIAINAGIAVTVPSGCAWTIV